MINIIKSIDSFKCKEETIGNKLLLTLQPINDIGNLVGWLVNGYAVCPGLFDYEEGQEYIDNRFQKGVVDYSCFERRWKLLNHWTGGWCVFLDIDHCNITAEQFIYNLDMKPSIAYYTYSGNHSNPRFRLVYCFSEFLPRNKWKGAAVGLLQKAEANNPGIKLDTASVSGVQIMYGTTPDKLVWYQNNYYTFQELGCREIDVDYKPRRNIIWEIKTRYNRGNEFLDCICGKVKIPTNDQHTEFREIPTIDTDIVAKKFYKEMRWIYRTELTTKDILIPWIDFQDGNIIYSYQLIDRDSYLEVWPPNGRIQPGGRRKALLSYAEEVILMKEDVSPWELLYSLILYRRCYINYGYKTKNTVKKKDMFGSRTIVTKDIIGINELIDIATTALSTPIDQILEHQQNWITRNMELNTHKTFIINKKAKRFDGGRWKDYFPSKDELNRVRKRITDYLKNNELNRKLEEFYQTNPTTTPIAVVAECVGVERSTLYKRITNPIPLDRKPHAPHKLKISEDFWRENYDPNLSVRENMRKMKISSKTFYSARDRWGCG